MWDYMVNKVYPLPDEREKRSAVSGEGGGLEINGEKWKYWNKQEQKLYNLVTITATIEVIKKESV